MYNAKTGDIIQQKPTNQDSDDMPQTQQLKDSFDSFDEGWHYRLNYEHFCYEASRDGVTWELIQGCA